MQPSEITNLVYKVADHLDQGELIAAATLFQRAQVQLQPESEPLDCEQLLQVWQQDLDNRDGEVTTRHSISNPIVEVDAARHSARCRSHFLVLEGGIGQTLQLVAAGRYQDDFVYEDGQWHFAFRQCLVDQGKPQEAAPPAPHSPGPAATTERSAPTREKILAAAQQVFSSVGYSEAGIRRIAEVVGLSPTILLRHFGTKAGLFEAAFVASMGGSRPPVDRADFGRHVANLLADPTQTNCPHAMSLLATGNEEAREIAIRVLKQYTILPMMEWLGEPHRESRAKQIMALCAGFALYNTQLNVSDSKSVDHHMVDWLANSIQAIVDEAC